MVTRPTPHSTLKRDLATVTRRKARTKEADDEAAAERDRVIRDALDAGMSRAEVIEATGLSPARIEQIKRGKRL